METPDLAPRTPEARQLPLLGSKRFFIVLDVDLLPADSDSAPLLELLASDASDGLFLRSPSGGWLFAVK